MNRNRNNHKQQHVAEKDNKTSFIEPTTKASFMTEQQILDN